MSLSETILFVVFFSKKMLPALEISVEQTRSEEADTIFNTRTTSQIASTGEKGTARI